MACSFAMRADVDGRIPVMKIAHQTEHEQIADLAFRIYEQDGQPEGMAEEHWIRAEQALKTLKQNEVPEAETPEPSPENFRP